LDFDIGFGLDFNPGATGSDPVSGAADLGPAASEAAA